MSRPILVIRGGGIGDFVLTIPALGLIREGFPGVDLEVLGYRRVVGLVRSPRYASAVRSMDSGAMAACFHPTAGVDPSLVEYFLSFGQVVSYLYDPDELFERKLRAMGVKHFLAVDPRVRGDDHAAMQLARPLAGLGLFLEDPCAVVEPSEVDRMAAARVLGDLAAPWVAVHVGSGGEKKNWPISRWGEILRWLRAEGMRVAVVGGEADEERLRSVREDLAGEVVFLENLPLGVLAACLERCRLFLGHDSGISHLAAAVGARCVLLFGPTNPAVWAPANPHVRVLLAPGGAMHRLETRAVVAACREELSCGDQPAHKASSALPAQANLKAALTSA